MSYAGATSRLELADAARLSPDRWALQEKVDGCYARLSLDAQGRVANILSRTGRPYTTEAARSLIGCHAGTPYSELVGELEDHTEAGRRAAQRRRYACVHLFDAIRIGREYVAGLPYRERRDALLRMVVSEERADCDRNWLDDETGRAHGEDGTFVRRLPTRWRRFPVVAQHALSELEQLWARVDGDQIEGLVAVNLDAPMGRRAAKRKIKPVFGIDCTVIASDPTGIIVHWPAGSKTFAVTTSNPPPVGVTVEVLHNHFYDDGRPRFARLARVRTDLC